MDLENRITSAHAAQTFLVSMEAYAKFPEPERRFFEQIRERYACNEYYDIDLHTKLNEIGEDRIALLEQQVFTEFLGVRSQYAPAYYTF
ncbi:hypothetical protein BGZ99_004352 [Dissophora globulifera]|uniref:Uncharacterized protein n=1 Tax=Dissophora globulifera TaxID=979702 RepID=A0A9P6RKJ7_9FUNG|nr:hypothetical protein BGZ99_004352 [Dissophora globulifera]